MNLDSSSKKWYVVRVIGGQELKIKKYIENEIKKYGVEDSVEEVLVPVEKIYTIKNGKKESKEKVLFSGYVIVRASLEGEVTYMIKSVPGIVGFLSEKKGGEPVPMRESEVKRMLGVMDSQENILEDPSSFIFVENEMIKVVDGPFKGFEGVILNIVKEKMKLEVEVKIFGRKTPLELNFNQVEKIV